jgi:hypothetical protein
LEAARAASALQRGAPRNDTTDGIDRSLAQACEKN